jgi:tetratricopeptide (TPR) repeat protein
VITLQGSAERPLHSLVASGRFREALALFCELSDRPGHPLDHDQLLLVAQAAARVGEFELASRLAEAAREGFEAAGQAEGMLEATNLLGGLAFERGRMDQAEARFEDVLWRASQYGRTMLVARSANNLASISHLKGRPAQAGALYEKALLAFEQLDDSRGIAETCHNIALTRRRSGALAEASRYCERSVAAAERLGEPGLLSLALLGRAELRIEQEAFDEANADIDRAELLAWTAGNEPHRLEADRLRAVVSLRQGQAVCAHLRAEAVRVRAAEVGCALITAQAASVSALALLAVPERAKAVVARDWAVQALQALGAVEILERFHEDWQHGSGSIPGESGARVMPLDYD